jgi:class 3 adenylate cyclase
VKPIFQRVGKTPIIPISVKILVIFLILLLFSNFATNYITILLSRREAISLTNQLLVRELRELYINVSNQYQIFLFSNDRRGAMNSIVTAAERSMIHPNSWALGVEPDGELAFKTSAVSFDQFPDLASLREMAVLQTEGTNEGVRFFQIQGKEYFGVYKYHEEWGLFLIRAELMSDLLRSSNRVFLIISVIIIVLTVLFIVTGLFAFFQILRFIGKITNALYEMQNRQGMSLIDLEGAPNDDITYLGVSFNALSSTINNLLTIFRKFTSQDMVNKAYQNRYINLEGEPRDLTILFSDIRSFTYMTETLGNDIINLLNLHYHRAIRVIHEQEGIIGSIIGDALLAVYGAADSGGGKNKSLAALQSGWALHEAAGALRESMIARRKEIESRRALTEKEEEVFKAVLLDIGVGIDGGSVFYGTVGSSERMTNTVIGDNVNAASRLEGLTRVYGLPIIVSSYVKDEILSVTDRYRFFEIDMVLVKGKTEGKKIFFPLDTQAAPGDIEDLEIFEQALPEYYAGRWREAVAMLRKCNHRLADVFRDRIKNRNPPEGWSGIWTMNAK